MSRIGGSASTEIEVAKCVELDESRSREAGKLKDLGDGRTRATYRLEADPGRILGMAIGTGRRHPPRSYGREHARQAEGLRRGLVVHQATFAVLTTSRSFASSPFRLRQAM
jgi:hypothetical protein